VSRKRTHRNNLLVRLLAILRELDRRDGCDIEELATRHQVATRTIRRDLDALEEAGVPLVADDDGRRKRWRIAHTDPRRQLASVVDASHCLAIRAALGGAAPSGSISFDTLRDLASKLERAFGGRERARLAALADCFVPPEGRALNKTGTDVLWPIMTAITEHRCCRVTYAPMARPPHAAEVLPLRLFTAAGTIYVLVHHREHDAVATLALHRIEKLAVTDEVVVPPANFDPAQYVASLFAVHGTGTPVHYRLRFSPEVAPYIRERQWHSSQRVRGRRDGGVSLDFTCQQSFEVTAWIASWRHHVTVLAPPSVRAELRDLGQSLAKRYATREIPPAGQRTSTDTGATTMKTCDA
jgi:predicted DNA-binding transcriptional regulator YafY